MSSDKIRPNDENLIDALAASGMMLGMNLKQIIKEHGRTQRWVAKKLGLREDTFSRIVLGKQPLPAGKVEPLAQVLGVSIKDVLRAIATYENNTRTSS